jgi:hypothetical protein
MGEGELTVITTLLLSDTEESLGYTNTKMKV